MACEHINNQVQKSSLQDPFSNHSTGPSCLATWSVNESMPSCLSQQLCHTHRNNKLGGGAFFLQAIFTALHFSNSYIYIMPGLNGLSIQGGRMAIFWPPILLMPWLERLPEPGIMHIGGRRRRCNMEMRRQLHQWQEEENSCSSGQFRQQKTGGSSSSVITQVLEKTAS